MDIDISAVASGKTTRIVEWVKKDKKNVLVTFSAKESERLKRLYPEIENRIYCWEEWLVIRYSQPHDILVGIDNADLIVQQMTMRSVEKITLSK